jgi:predicted transposase/invertase (TIGR01784 family)
MDLRTDFAFKKIFATEQHKELLIAFLNQVFKGKKKILDITYQQTVHTGDTAEARSTVFDIRCTGAGGEEFIIEMQRAAQPHFSKRMLCYSSALVTELTKRGQLWDFNLPEIYLVAVVDFHIQQFDSARCLHHWQWYYDDPDHHTALDSHGFFIVELPKFNKETTELETEFDKWCYLFKHLGELDEIPVSLSTGGLKKLFSLAEVSNLSKEEYTMYQYSLLAKQSDYAARQYAREQGEKEGIEKTIRGLLALNTISVTEISKATGWSEEAIQKIKDSIK